MALLKVVVDKAAVARMVSDVQKKQLPFAVAQAINDTAFQVMRSEREAMKTVFAHPRPFTQKATIVSTKATKASPVAVVSVKPEAERYLAPYEFGGNHVLPGRGMALLNPKALRLDQSGQIRGRPSAIGSRAGVFVAKIPDKNGIIIAGFWRRLKNHKLQLLVRFGDALPVKKHLDFVKRGEALVAKAFPKALETAMAKALTRR